MQNAGQISALPETTVPKDWTFGLQEFPLGEMEVISPVFDFSNPSFSTYSPSLPLHTFIFQFNIAGMACISLRIEYTVSILDIVSY